MGKRSSRLYLDMTGRQLATGVQEGGAILLKSRGELKNDGIQEKAASLMDFKAFFGTEALIDGHGKRDTPSHHTMNLLIYFHQFHYLHF